MTTHTADFLPSILKAFILVTYLYVREELVKMVIFHDEVSLISASSTIA